jgi:hypothetical protein
MVEIALFAIQLAVITFAACVTIICITSTIMFVKKYIKR